MPKAIVLGRKNYWQSSPLQANTVLGRGVRAIEYSDDWTQKIGEKTGTGLHKWDDLPYDQKFPTAGLATLSGTTLDVSAGDVLTLTSPAASVTLTTIVGMKNFERKDIFIGPGPGVISFATTLVSSALQVRRHNNQAAMHLHLWRLNNAYYAEFSGPAKLNAVVTGNILSISLDDQTVPVTLPAGGGGSASEHILVTGNLSITAANQDTYDGQVLVFRSGSSTAPITVTIGSGLSPTFDMYVLKETTRDVFFAYAGGVTINDNVNFISETNGIAWIYAVGPDDYDYEGDLINAQAPSLAITVSGTAQVGNTLTGNITYNGAFPENQAARQLQWYSGTTNLIADMTPVSVATTSQYNLTAGDVPKYFALQGSTVATAGILQGQTTYSNVVGPVSAAVVSYTLFRSIKVALSRYGQPVPITAPEIWNNSTKGDPKVVGIITASLLDTAGNPTGIPLSIAQSFSGADEWDSSATTGSPRVSVTEEFPGAGSNYVLRCAYRTHQGVTAKIKIGDRIDPASQLDPTHKFNLRVTSTTQLTTGDLQTIARVGSVQGEYNAYLNTSEIAGLANLVPVNNELLLEISGKTYFGMISAFTIDEYAPV